MPNLFIDFESRSKVGIYYGTDLYTRDCEAIIGTWALDERPVGVWDITATPDMPAELYDALEDERVTLIAHNAQFDRNVLKYALHWPTSVERWRCTSAQARAHGLPGSLETLGAVLEIPDDCRKLADDGHTLIQLFCIPKADGTYNDVRSHREEWLRFLGYAARDTAALREIHRRLPANNYRGTNLDVWHIDQRINSRGFKIDVPLAWACVGILGQAKNASDGALAVATQGTITAATQRQRLLVYLRAKHGLDIENLKAATVREYLEADDISPEVRFLLQARLDGSKSAGAKYKRGLGQLGPGDRIRHALTFGGAGRTGRWSGKGFQPHNLPRPAITTLRNGRLELTPVKAGYIDEVIIPGIYSGDVLSSPETFGTANEACGLALRHTIVAGEGNELVVADYSNIESVKLAWLADEKWKLDLFRAKQRDPHNKQLDAYRTLYSRFFGTPLDKVNDNERQAGKVVELACVTAETLCLTSAGYKRIIDVQLHDKLWDGVEWVNHAGLVAKGAQPVVDVDGIKVTASHQIKCGHFWRAARELASCHDTLRLALATGSENLPSWVPRPTRGKARAFLSGARAAQLRTASIAAACGAARVPAATAVPKLRADGPLRMMLRYSAPRIAGDFLIGLLRRFGAAITYTIGATRTTALAGSRCAPNGAGTGVRFSASLCRWLDSMMRPWKWTGATTTGIISREISASAQKRTTTATSENVYDIAHCGPRNRFTIKTNSGHLQLHNCGFGGGVGAFVTMAAGYNIDLDTLPALILPSADEDTAKKAYRAWRRAFLMAEDYGIEADVFMACHVLVQKYRAANENINQMRHDIGAAVIGAIKEPGKGYNVARSGIWVSGGFLIIQLPSGRRLLYASPKIEFEQETDVETGKITRREYVTYITARGKSWHRERAWAGLFLENIVQGSANDILRVGLRKVHERTLAKPDIAKALRASDADERTAIVLHVHDEIVVEAPVGAYTEAELHATITEPIDWCAGMPLMADTWHGPRYGKRG